MEWVEFSASSVAEARERALDELGVDETDAEFEVLEEPRAGLFGRTRGVARVRARVLPRAPRPKQERPRKRSGGSGGGSGGRKRTRTSTSGDSTESAAAEEQPEPSNSNGGGGGQRSQGRDQGSRRQERSTMEAAEQEAVASEFVSGLSRAIGLETTVSAELTEDNDLRVEIDGSEVGLFIGPGLRTLDALQEITRHVVQREAGDREYGRVVVDVAGVRETRRTALAAFVRTTAQRAVDEGTSIPFEPMSSPDRKIVHDTIAEIDGAESTSQGEEPNRRVVVRPA